MARPADPVALNEAIRETSADTARLPSPIDPLGAGNAGIATSDTPPFAAPVDGGQATGFGIRCGPPGRRAPSVRPAIGRYPCPARLFGIFPCSPGEWIGQSPRAGRVGDSFGRTTPPKMGD